MDREKDSNEKRVSIIIVGAGPTGLTMANLLGMAGIDTLILERSSGLSDLPKAIALDDEALRICQATGLLEPILQHVLLDISARYVSGKRLLGRVAPTGKRNGFPLISTFQQPQFEAILLAGLKRFTCVNVSFQHNVEAIEQTEQSVIVTVRTPEGSLKKTTCAYLLACDGGKSSIRRALSIPMQGSTFAQKWLVIDSINDENPSKTITFFCNPQRPAVTVPAPQQGRRWEFMLLPGEQEADLLRPETIRTLIQQVGGTHNPQIIRQAIYTFHAVLAKTFSKGRVFLLGDAAHQMPPFSGQGMNSGLRDAHNLSWKLSLVLQGLANPSLLDTYNEERREHSAQMINLSRFAGNVVMPTAKPVALLRDAIFLALNTIPAAREYFTEMRIKPQPRYKKGFLLPQRVGARLWILKNETGHPIHHGAAVGADLSRPPPIYRPVHIPVHLLKSIIAPTGKASRAMTGVMLPQPEVTTWQGDKVLLDEVLGAGFALLRYHDNPAEAFVPLKADIWTQLDVRFVCVQPAMPPGTGSVALPPVVSTSMAIIRSTEISAYLRHDSDLFVLVRPDRYIFGAFRQEQAASFAAALQRLLQS